MSYSSGYFTTRETWRDWRIEAAHLMRLAHVRRGSLVLEIGCGAGGLLRLLGARGARAVGIDPLALGLELARHRVRHAQLVRVAAGPELPFQADTLDAILGQHVLEHISDVNTAMQEWRRVLKPGGWLALATPNADYPDPAHFADEDHDHVFSPQELRSAAEQAGLAVECCYTIFPYLSRRRWLRGFGVVGHQTVPPRALLRPAGENRPAVCHEAPNQTVAKSGGQHRKERRPCRTISTSPGAPFSGPWPSPGAPPADWG